MKFELFIAKRLQLYNNDDSNKSSSVTLNFALIGIVLAIVIMIASLSIIAGFKSTIIDKIANIQPHIEIKSGNYDENNHLCDSISKKAPFTTLDNPNIEQISLTGESVCILKTKTDFNGLVFKGITNDYSTEFLEQNLVAGEIDTNSNDIIISEKVANKLNLKVGERINVFFIVDQLIKQRKLTIGGIYNTHFEDFDDHYVIGNLSTIQSINQWGENTGSAIEIKCKNFEMIDSVKASVVDNIYQHIYETGSTDIYQIRTVTETNSTYFAWLELLDTNIIVILVLMILVSCFSLIAGLLIIVLNRINMIGILKSIGATNKSIRMIFIHMIQKLILKAMLLGNLIGFSLILIQKYFHVIELSADKYYMSYVPIEINSGLIYLNIGILIISLLALIGPSYIVTSINPARTSKFE